MRLSQLRGVSVQEVAESLYIHPFMLSRWRKEVREGKLVTKGVQVDKDIAAELKLLRNAIEFKMPYRIMRAVAFLLVLVLSVAGADMPLKSQQLDAQEKVRLSRHAIETCDRTPVEVSGSSYEVPEGGAWEAYALVYMAPHKSEVGLCKSRVCEYVASKPKARGERAPGDFSWGKPVGIGGYSVWLSQNGECLGNPSSQIALINPIEENTLVSLIEKSHALAEGGKAWLRGNRPDSVSMLDHAVGEFVSISVEDDFGVLRYRLVYGGAKGLQVRVGTRDGGFIVHEAGAPPRP